MGESLMERRCVQEEGLRVVNCCRMGRTLTVPYKKGAPNLVPAGAVIREPQALPEIIGRKASAGGSVSLLLKPWAQPMICSGNGTSRGR